MDPIILIIDQILLFPLAARKVIAKLSPLKHTIYLIIALQFHLLSLPLLTFVFPPFSILHNYITFIFVNSLNLCVKWQQK